MTPRRSVVACVQLCASCDPARNLDEAAALIREAAGRGAGYVQTPEHAVLMQEDGERRRAAAVPEDESEPLRRYRALAAELGIWLHLGSLVVQAADERLVNRSYLLAPEGEIAARYDKIHLFDAELPGEPPYLESRDIFPGGRAIVCDLPWAAIGLTIGYDLRFPDLYRTLAKSGASLLACPAAMPAADGAAHWHVLGRARAIENGAFLIAAAQGGAHESGRTSFGHSIIVGPWGDVLAEAGTEPGVVTAEIDIEEVRRARQRMPSLTQDRPFDQPPELHDAPARIAS